MQNKTTDFVSLMIFIAAALFSTEVATVVGPYVAIIVAASVGASFALARREKATRMAAAIFFLRIVGLAVLLTVALAQLANGYFPAANERLTLIPIALMVGFIGDTWPQVLGKVLEKLLGLLDYFRKDSP